MLRHPRDVIKLSVDFCLKLLRERHCFSRYVGCTVVRSTAVYLNVGSANGCQGFRETKIRNGGRVILAVQNLYARV